MLGEFLETPLGVSVASGALAVVAATFGFILKSVQTHSRPMARILGFENDKTNAPPSIRISDELQGLLKSIRTGVFEYQSMSIEVMTNVRDTLNRYEKASGEFFKEVESYLSIVNELSEEDSVGSIEARNALKELVSYTIFDLMLITCVGRGIVPLASSNEDKPVVIKVVRANANDGCYMAFLPDPVAIGSSLNDEPANEHYYQEFSSLLERAEHHKIAAFFTELVRLLQSDMAAIKDASKEISELIRQHSVFSASIYVANITDAPMLIYPSAELAVHEVKTHRGKLRAHMVLAAFVQKSGTKILVTVEDAIVVPSGGDIRLVAYTKPRTQLESGGVIQAVFSEGSSKATVRLNTESIGYFGRKSLSTPRYQFAGKSVDD